MNLIDNRAGMVNNKKTLLLLALILLFALVIRLGFFMGITFSDDADEGCYLSCVYHILKKEYKITYQHRPPDQLPNPAEAFPFRYVMVFTPVFFYRLFGVSELTTVLFPLLCSLATIVLVFYMASFLFNTTHGLVASLLYALFPLDIVFATRLMPDSVLPLFFWGSLFLFLKGETMGDRKWAGIRLSSWCYLMSGMVTGISYYIKFTFLLVFLLIFIYMIIKRSIKWNHVLLIVGFLAMVLPECIYYRLHGEDFFLSYKICTGIVKSKFRYENAKVVKMLPGFFHVYILQYETEVYGCILRSIRYITTMRLYYFGLFWPFFIISSGYMFWRREKKLYMFFLWVVALYLFFEFGPLSLIFRDRGAWVNYYLTVVRMRYLSVMMVPMVLTGAFFLVNLRMRVVTALILLLLFVSSFISVSQYRSYYHSGVASMKEAHAFLEGRPDAPVYSDFTSMFYFMLLSGFKKDSRYRSVFLDPVKKGYVVVGGSRGIDEQSVYIKECVDQILRKSDGRWKLVKVIPDAAVTKEDPVIYNLLIYKVE